jgi:sphingolipid 4-desaturase/C4-monooxygenase
MLTLCNLLNVHTCTQIILNVGYHNEHHDFSKVPWTRLPEIKAAAPEYYNNLYYHTSVFAILLDFLRREDQGPHSRIARTKDAHQVSYFPLLP